MKFTPQQYAQALYDSIRDTAPKNHDVILDNFVKILAQAGDLTKYKEIEKEYKLLEMKEQGISSAEITVAKEIEINSGLVNQLNEIIGSKTEIKKQIDEKIVGGIIVRVDDTLIDASVKTQLENLNKQLKS